jgi:hypothetical protein
MGLRFFANVVEGTKGSEGLNAEEKEKVRKVVEEVEGDKEWTPENVGMAESEWTAFKDAVKA